MKRIFSMLVSLILCLLFVDAVATSSTSDLTLYESWKCSVCGSDNTTNYCEDCGAIKPTWICACGKENHRNFCGDCGKGYANLSSKFDEALKKASLNQYQDAIAELYELGEFNSGTFSTSVGDYATAKRYILKTYYDQGIYLVSISGDHEKIIESFSKAENYNDAEKQIQDENDRYYGSFYEEGVLHLNNGEYQAAIEAFTQAGKYGNAKEQIQRIYYDLAEKALALNEYVKAIELFTKAGNYLDSSERVLKTHYDFAEAALAEEDLETALVEFTAANSYHDAQSRAKSTERAINLLALTEKRWEKAIGTYIQFGTYKQNIDTSNDSEAIDWLVLDYDEANYKVLLLSRYGLDVVPYNKEQIDTTWEKCTLRTWLNNDFLNNAFSAKEQSAILVTTVTNDSSQGYSGWHSDGGNDTQDRVFLLSYAEANRYLGVLYNDSDNKISRVAPTEYAVSHGAWISDHDQTEDNMAASWWWLRSPGNRQDYAAFVKGDGLLGSGSISLDRGVVRPALWMNLDSDLFLPAIH